MYFSRPRHLSCASGNGSRRMHQSPSPVMKAYSVSTFLLVISLTRVQNDLKHTHTQPTQKNGQRWEPAAKSRSQQSGQLTRQQQPDGTAGIVSFCCKVARGWHNILPLDCFQSRVSLSPMVSLCNYPHSRRLQTSLYPANKMQLVGHTSCQTTHGVRFRELRKSFQLYSISNKNITVPVHRKL